jgi:hypothetical protein
VAGAFRSLADGASTLAEHVGGGNVAAVYMARALERESRQALDLYGESPERTRVFARRAVEYCMGCHAERPSAADSPLSKGFVDSGAFDSLSAVERAELQVALRQFEPALRGYEELLRSPSMRPVELVDPLISYLKVSLRVKRDFERPQATLRGFAERRDLWDGLRADVRIWIDTLGRLEAMRDAKPSVQKARALIEEGRSELAPPLDRRGIVQDVVASGMLQRFIDAHPEPSPEVAEAYWLLGLTECQIGRNFWLSRADFFLETAIRMAPEQPFATEAYRLLEEQTVLEHYEYGLSQLPADVARHLDGLRALLPPASRNAPPPSPERAR